MRQPISLRSSLRASMRSLTLVPSQQHRSRADARARDERRRLQQGDASSIAAHASYASSDARHDTRSHFHVPLFILFAVGFAHFAVMAGWACLALTRHAELACGIGIMVLTFGLVFGWLQARGS